MLIAFRLFFFERSKGISMYKRKEAKKKEKKKRYLGQTNKFMSINALPCWFSFTADWIVHGMVGFVKQDLVPL
jgi:hypothetical protein